MSEARPSGGRSARRRARRQRQWKLRLHITAMLVGLMLVVALAAIIAVLLSDSPPDQNAMMSADEYSKTRWAPRPEH